jgi:hypothetical protein
MIPRPLGLGYSSRKPPLFATMFSISVQLQIKPKTKHVTATYFLQLLINNVGKYKLRMKL